MKYDVYGRFTIEIAHEEDTWAACRLATGKRLRISEMEIPGGLRANEIALLLDDHFHELSRPERVVRLLAH